MLLRTKVGLAVCICVGLSGCARSATELPPDYASVNAQPASAEDFEQADLDATCQDIAAEKAGIAGRYKTLEQQITSSRQEEQTAGYLSAVLFPPAALAIDRKEEEREKLDEMQLRLDKLAALSHFKGCEEAAPSTGSLPVQ